MHKPQPLTPERASALNPLTLAFVGDAVSTLYVRAKLVARSDKKAGALHDEAVHYVSAYGQAAAYDKLFDTLTDSEHEICRRARNAHNSTVAKNTDLETYKKATALEALIGYYYLIGEEARLEQILSAVV